MKSTQTIARELCPTIGRLDSLLVPLAHGGRDGHGHRIGTEREIQDRLRGGLSEAKAAIQNALEDLNQATTQHSTGNPS